MTIRAPRLVYIVTAIVAAALSIPAEAQQKTSLVFSAGPTGGTWTPMAAATAEVIKKSFPSSTYWWSPGRPSSTWRRCGTTRPISAGR
jgi:hypothetical protein